MLDYRHTQGKANDPRRQILIQILCRQSGHLTTLTLVSITPNALGHD